MDTLEEMKKKLEAMGGDKSPSKDVKKSEEPKKVEEVARSAADQEFHDRYMEKVNAGVVPPPANASEEVKTRFAEMVDADRKKRAEEHLAIQKEATESYLASQPERARMAKQPGDAPKNVDSSKAQPSSGGPVGATTPPGGTTTSGAPVSGASSVASGGTGSSA